jgi:hypothetical protein
MSSLACVRVVTSMRHDVAEMLREVANDEAACNPAVAERLRDIALAFEYALPPVANTALEE